ncbi:MAG: hypothetical protein ACPGYL_08145 [Rhodospirillaceae bacterium]
MTDDGGSADPNPAKETISKQSGTDPQAEDLARREDQSLSRTVLDMGSVMEQTGDSLDGWASHVAAQDEEVPKISDLNGWSGAIGAEEEDDEPPPRNPLDFFDLDR